MIIYKHHKNYSVFTTENDHFLYKYSDGKIESVQMLFEKDCTETTIVVKYKSGETYTWKNKYFKSYIDQFGVAVSIDGEKIFAQTWESGLFCFNAKSGEQIWRTKSRRGITDVFVNDETILVHQHEHALQLIDINSGEVLKEKRPATAWGFYSLDSKYLICQTTTKKWELIEAETLNTKKSFSHKEFTGNHTDFEIKDVKLIDNNIIVHGFKNMWDNSANPPKMLPNLEFEHTIKDVL